jgi:hypothetical protein
MLFLMTFDAQTCLTTNWEIPLVVLYRFVLVCVLVVLTSCCIRFRMRVWVKLQQDGNTALTADKRGTNSTGQIGRSRPAWCDEQNLWRMPSSGMLRHMALVRTDVSEELSASFIRVTRIGELGTTLAVTSNRRTLRRNTKRPIDG